MTLVLISVHSFYIEVSLYFFIQLCKFQCLRTRVLAQENRLTFFRELISVASDITESFEIRVFVGFPNAFWNFRSNVVVRRKFSLFRN